MARALYIVAALLLASTAAATWTSLCTKNSQCPTMMMGVSCKDESLCAIAGGYSNTPMGVYYSQNGFSDGKFTLSKMDGDSAMIMDIAIDSSGAGATAGMGLLNNSAILYSENVMEWKTSTDISFMVGQDMVAFGNGEFGYVGEIDNTKNTQGVLISSDGGKDWNPSYWPKNLSDFTQARYGAFPSDKVMYVSGGHWPSNRAELDINCYRLSAKTCVPSLKRNTRTAFNRDAGSQSTYYAVLTKSSDGGKTWEKQFSHSGSFYFNDIDCYDENTCFAVGEGFTDGGNPGARIYGTTDGGKTWTRVYFSTATGASLMRVHMLSKTEAWAAGGDVKDGVAQGTFYHTTDGGKTWSLSGTAEYVGDVMGLHFTSPSTGYAVGITQFQTSTLLKFSSSTATQ